MYEQRAQFGTSGIQLGAVTKAKLERVEELETQLAREEEDVATPIVHDVGTTAQEQVDRHEATHTPYQRRCRHCNEGLTMRDRHKDIQEDQDNEVR